MASWSIGWTYTEGGVHPLTPGLQIYDRRERALVGLADAALAPHFAYGALDKNAYRRAHLMHLADHAREIVRA